MPVVEGFITILPVTFSTLTIALVLLGHPHWQRSDSPQRD